MVIDEFVDPKTKARLKKDETGNLCSPKGPGESRFANQDGTYDFTQNNGLDNELAFYAGKYERAESFVPPTVNGCRREWHDRCFPENIVLLKSLGDLAGKKVLLLGNGVSRKEYYFLKLGAKIVYTDISIEAVKLMKRLFCSSEMKNGGSGAIDFHGVDALNLPFPDSSFDIIYGYASIHHIHDLNGLFLEIDRCLKAGGMCRFLDDGYSPFWQLMKKAVLRQLQAYSHRKSGISPEDFRATERGGYKEEEIEGLMRQFGFKKMIFERVSFFQHLWTRGIIKLFRSNAYLVKMGIVMGMLDKILFVSFPGMKKNGLRLIWGFNK
jgi:SAM-dependent methyltransferase